MKHSNAIFLIFLILFSFHIHAEDIYNKNHNTFKGIVKQSHDYSCGSAALSTLITGVIKNSSINEKTIIKAITGSDESKEAKGFTATELADASKKLGYRAKWQGIAPSNLPKIKQPILLLIGLNSDFPHYVVLKGIKNEMAFLADPIRGNIRVPYQKLIKEGINDKHPAWLAMAVIPSKNKPKNSTLYLSDNETERLANHVTAEQSNAITLATVSKQGQFIADYSLTASLGKNKQDNLTIKSQNFIHQLNIRYGLTEDLEVGGRIQYSDSETEINSNFFQQTISQSDRKYSLYFNNHFQLDDSGRNHLNAGLDISYGEDWDIFGGSFTLTTYRNTDFAQILLGGSIGKDFSYHEPTDEQLPDYYYSAFMGVNKPLGDRFLGSLSFGISDSEAKHEIFKRDTLYSATTGLTYVINKKYQVSPSFTYSFGDSEIFSFGINIAYIGSW